MSFIFENIRKVCVFLLLLVLNMRFIISNIVDEKTNVLMIICIILAFLSFDYRSLLKGFLLMILLVIFAAIVDYSYNKVSILTILLLMQCAYSIDIKTYLKFNVIILGVSALTLFVIYGKGDLEMWDSISDVVLDRQRYNFKMGHPNVAALYYYGLLICSLLLLSISKYKALLPLGFVIAAAIAYYISIETVSRSFVLSVIAFIIVGTYYSIRKWISPSYRLGFSKYILLSFPILCLSFTVYIGLNYEDYPVLDLMLSSRPMLYNDFFQTIELKNFVVGTDAFDDIIIDNGYLHITFQVGIVFLLFFLWIYFFSMKKIIEQQNILLLASIISALTYSLMESFLVNPVMIGTLVFLVLFYKYLHDKDSVFDLASNDTNTE